MLGSGELVAAFVDTTALALCVGQLLADTLGDIDCVYAFVDGTGLTLAESLSVTHALAVLDSDGE